MTPAGAARWRALGAPLALLAAVALAHGGALGHGFVHFDDDLPPGLRS